MAFFVEAIKVRRKSEGVYVSERLDLEWIAAGKRAGLSLTEINELRVRDLAAYIDIYTGADKDKPREATKDDIDKFFN